MNKFKFIETGVVELDKKKHTTTGAIFAGISIHSDWIKKVSQQTTVGPTFWHPYALACENHDRFVCELIIPSNISIAIAENLLFNCYFEWKQKKFLVKKFEYTLEEDFWSWVLECGSFD